MKHVIIDLNASNLNPQSTTHSEVWAIYRKGLKSPLNEFITHFPTQAAAESFLKTRYRAHKQGSVYRSFGYFGSFSIKKQ